MEINASSHVGRKEKTGNPKEMFSLVCITRMAPSQAVVMQGLWRGSPRASVYLQGHRGKKPGSPRGTPPEVQGWPSGMWSTGTVTHAQW